MGAKMSPMMRRIGRTVLGVRIGCQAFSLCCLKAVSTQGDRYELPHAGQSALDVLAGFRQLPFSFLVPSSSPFFLRLNIAMGAVVI